MNALAHRRGHVAPALVDPFARVPAPIDDALGVQARRHFRDGDITAILIRALAACYPVVRRLAGDDSFLAAARRYICSEPPHLAAVLQFGERFPGYLRSLGSAASFQYLADVAELEAARARAFRSADAAPVEASALAALPASRFGEIGVILHPSVSLIASRFPIVTVWAANQSDTADGIIHRWGAEAALVARPFLDVIVLRLPPGGHAFLSRLSDGTTLSTAIEMAITQDSGFDSATNLRVLIDANIIVGLHHVCSDLATGARMSANPISLNCDRLCADLMAHCRDNTEPC